MKTLFARLTNPCSALLMAVAGVFGISGTPSTAQTVVREQPVVREQTVVREPAVTQVREGSTVRETRVDGRLHLTGPDSVTITTANSDPTTYRYAEGVQYVDDAGVVLSREQ